MKSIITLLAIAMIITAVAVSAWNRLDNYGTFNTPNITAGQHEYDSDTKAGQHEPDSDTKADSGYQI